MIDLSFNYPSTAGQEELIQRHMTSVWSDSTLNLSAPRPYFGDPQDIESIGPALLGSQSGMGESRLALTCSGQAALATAIAAVCVRPGARFAAEPWNFPQFIHALPLFGASAVVVEMDERGMVPDSLERVCEQGKVDAVYTMPTFHNPNGIVMPIDRRKAIAAIARRHNLVVIEDDAYAFLEAEEHPTIRSFAPERTLQVFSLSKVFSLALRLGAVVMPEAIASRTADYIRFAGIAAQPAATAAAAAIVREGELSTLVKGKRAEGAARFEIARSILGDRARPVHVHGWHILVATPNGIPGTRFVQRARAEAGIAISPGNAYRLDGSDEPVVRVSFGGERDRAVVADGMARLAELFAR